MEDILQEIVDFKRKEIKLLKEKFTFSDFEQARYFTRTCYSLLESLKEKEFGIIAEIKRKSPSAKDILPDLIPSEIALEYQNSEAAGISILTDNKFFGGKKEDIESVRDLIHIPILRKDFILDEIQIFEAKAIGVDVILLIAEILTKEQIQNFTTLAKSLGMEVLLEIHSFNQLNKINAEIDLLGVNNRNLKTQTTDLNNSYEMASFLPESIFKISESGITTKSEIEKLQKLGFRGALIGESILRNRKSKNFNLFSNVN